MPMRFAAILFEGFETLDVFGPVEIFGMLPEKYAVEFYSMRGGLVRSTQNVRTDTLPVGEISGEYLLFLPGGMGTRALVNDAVFIDTVATLARNAKRVLSVCTGSALLARAGLLKGLAATTNKRAFEWASSNDREVRWQRRARWVRDGKFYTSSGVSAGMDMALGFISDTEGCSVAEDIARRIEYLRNDNPNDDPFAAEERGA